jgi:hypothetical protein
MHIDDLFHSPVGRLAAFSEMQVHLYRHDISLQDYFLHLQVGSLRTGGDKPRNHHPSSRLIRMAAHAADKISHFRRRRKIKTDVLFCPVPYFERKTEKRFLVRTLLGLAQTDAKILCLLPAGASCWDELNSELAAAGRSAQVTLFPLVSSSNPVEASLLQAAARMRGRAALDETVGILEPHGFSPSPELRYGFEHTAYFVEAWERLAPWVEFDAVVARCHWHTLCSPVCRTARQRGKSVITFQQGVIDHTLDVPLTVSKYVAFGHASANFLASMNERFFQAAGLKEPPVEYVEGGCLFDTVISLPDQFDNQTLLMIDVPNRRNDFGGLESQCCALLQLAERLLTSDLPLRRLVIRPHPYWRDEDFEVCQRLVREHSTRCELSHPVWSLEDDLRRSSAVIGVCSGALTVASACGLPTIFLQTEHGFTTGDLACFSPRQTLLPDAAFSEIGKLLSDRRAYAEARAETLLNAREYYANGTNLELDATFFERLLRTEPATRRPVHNLR